jgi:hypothetical protein
VCTEKGGCSPGASAGVRNQAWERGGRVREKAGRREHTGSKPGLHRFIRAPAESRATAFAWSPCGALRFDGVVLTHHSSCLHRKDPVQVLAVQGHKGMTWPLGPHPELPVHLRNVVFPQEAVRFLQRGDPGQAQFLRQPSLPGAKPPFAPSPRLRRVGRDNPDECRVPYCSLTRMGNFASPAAKAGPCRAT